MSLISKRSTRVVATFSLKRLNLVSRILSLPSFCLDELTHFICFFDLFYQSMLDIDLNKNLDWREGKSSCGCLGSVELSKLNWLLVSKTWVPSYLPKSVHIKICFLPQAGQIRLFLISVWDWTIWDQEVLSFFPITRGEENFVIDRDWTLVLLLCNRPFRPLSHHSSLGLLFWVK